MPEPPPPSYRVTRLPTALAAIRALGRQAARLGIRQVFIESLREIIQQLESRPLQWGDPEYHAVHKGGTVYHGIRFPLLVRYVAYEVEKVVVILDVRALPGDLLESNS